MGNTPGAERIIGDNGHDDREHNVEKATGYRALEVAPRPHLKHEDEHEQPEKKRNIAEKEFERFYSKGLNSYEVENSAQDKAGDGHDNPHRGLLHHALAIC